MDRTTSESSVLSIPPEVHSVRAVHGYSGRPEVDVADVNCNEILFRGHTCCIASFLRAISGRSLKEVLLQELSANHRGRQACFFTGVDPMTNPTLYRTLVKHL